MPRITIDLPPRFLYSTAITVRATDLNYGGHVGNDTILTYFQEARIDFYRSIGFNSELNFEGDVGQIIADAVVIYKSESFLADVLNIRIGVTEFNKYGFDMVYLITNSETGKEVALGKTGIVCFDYARRKIATIPAALREKLETGN